MSSTRAALFLDPCLMIVKKYSTEYIKVLAIWRNELMEVDSTDHWIV